MTEFYVVCYHKRFSKSITVDNLMVSAGHSHTKSKGFTLPKYALPYRRLFLDSGGYQLLNKFGDFPFSVDDYLNYVNSVKPDFFASMDYPCEPEISRKKGLRTNKERIDKTIGNTIEILDKWEGKSKFVPVIQGYTKNEYRYCVNQMQEQNLITDYMAIGSLCIRKEPNKVKAIIRLIHTLLPKIKIHCFGVTLNIFNDSAEMWNIVHSWDTQAWYLQQADYVQVFTGKRLKKVFPKKKSLHGREFNYIDLKAYLEYWNYLKSKYENTGQQKLVME